MEEHPALSSRKQGESGKEWKQNLKITTQEKKKFEGNVARKIGKFSWLDITQILAKVKTNINAALSEFTLILFLSKQNTLFCTKSSELWSDICVWHSIL